MAISELRDLQRKCWRQTAFTPSMGRMGHWVEVEGSISQLRFDSIMDAVHTHGLVCELRSVGFGFGRVGMSIYGDETYPGVGPDFLFCLSENHLNRSDFSWVNRPTMGSPHPEVMDLFAVALTETNVARLKALGLEVCTVSNLTY